VARRITASSLLLTLPHGCDVIITITPSMSTPRVGAVIANHAVCTRRISLPRRPGRLALSGPVPVREWCFHAVRATRRLSAWPSSDRPGRSFLAISAAGCPAPGDSIMTSTHVLYRRALTGHVRHQLLLRAITGAYENDERVRAIGCLARSRAVPATSGRTLASASLSQVRSEPELRRNCRRTGDQQRWTLFHVVRLGQKLDRGPVVVSAGTELVDVV